MAGRGTLVHLLPSLVMTPSSWLQMVTREAGKECPLMLINCGIFLRNVYAEKSKADDIQFILDLIAKVGEEIPAADMDNVNIAGSSNGAALTYQLLINTGADRPFHRAFPMVSSLVGVQYNNDQFWRFSAAATAGEANNFDTPSVPAFSSTFEVRKA